MEWRTLQLGEVCNISGGFGFPHSHQGNKSQKYPFYKVGDMNTEGNEIYMKWHNHSISEADVKTLKVKIFPAGTIIFPKIGGAISTNKKRILHSPSTVDNNVMTLVPSKDVDTMYLYYFLLNFDLNDWANKASLPSIRKSDVEITKIPIPFVNGKPDIAEQKRIVYELDKVLSLSAKTNTDTQTVENLFLTISNQFLSDNSRTQKIKLGDVCEVIKGQSPTMKTIKGQYPLVVTSEKRRSANTFQFDGEAVCIPLVSSTGHGHASLHRIHYENGKFALASIMVAVIPKDTSKLMTKYLYYYLSFYRNELLVSLMRGVANVTIPMRKINDVFIDIPDINEQKRFVSKLEDVEHLKRSLSHRKCLVEEYFQSSLNLAFSET